MRSLIYYHCLTNILNIYNKYNKTYIKYYNFPFILLYFFSKRFIKFDHDLYHLFNLLISSKPNIKTN